jgi:pimeloyl-ACP methyl ester carboxylesterase
VNVIYLHGFASGPKSAKALAVKARLEREGIACAVPDLNVPSFEHLRPSEAIARVLSLITGPCVVAGSSLGGLMALNAAAKDERVRALVLVNPALAAADRWRKMLGERELERWRREGTRRFYNFVTLREEPVDFGFFEDLVSVAEPPPPRVPVTLIHGRRDEVVPLVLSEEFARKNPERVTLTVVDDDHSLLKHVDLVNDSVLAAARRSP